jgi:hypothetical protein
MQTYSPSLALNESTFGDEAMKERDKIVIFGYAQSGSIGHALASALGTITLSRLDFSTLATYYHHIGNNAYDV